MFGIVFFVGVTECSNFIRNSSTKGSTELFVLLYQKRTLFFYLAINSLEGGSKRNFIQNVYANRVNFFAQRCMQEGLLSPRDRRCSLLSAVLNFARERDMNRVAKR